MRLSIGTFFVLPVLGQYRISRYSQNKIAEIAETTVDISKFRTNSTLDPHLQRILNGKDYFGRYLWTSVMAAENVKNLLNKPIDGVHCNSTTENCKKSSGYELTLKLRSAWATSKPRLAYDKYPHTAYLKYELTDKRFQEEWLDLNFDHTIYPGGQFRMQTEFLETTDYTQYSNIVLVSLGGCRGVYVAVVGRSKHGDAYLVLDHINKAKVHIVKKSVLDDRRRYLCLGAYEHEVYSVGAE